MSVVSVTGFYTEDEPRNKSIFFLRKKMQVAIKWRFSFMVRKVIMCAKAPAAECLISTLN